MIKKIQTLILLGLCTFITPTIFASEGVIEINQTCATQLGCFSGDFAGFPISMSSSISNNFRLTSNLTVSDLNLAAISINTSNINIDLNGFSITCVIANCKTDGTRKAIEGGVSGKNVLIKNGKISSFGAGGIEVSTNAFIYNMNVSNNGGHGIRTSSFSIIKNNIVDSNTRHGIISAGTITPSLGTIVSGNISNNNGYSGIKLENGSSAKSNITTNNTRNGIEAGAGSNIKGNTVQNNTLFGLKLDATAIYLQNVMVGNTGGSVSSGFDMGQNYCDTGICP